MNRGWYVTANDIEHWTKTNKRPAEGILPRLLLRLIRASCNPKEISFPSGDSITTGGWDGTVEVEKGNEYVPDGISGWEIGTEERANGKANGDYDKRTKKPKPLKRKSTTFVFATSRKWTKKRDWCEEKKSEKKWKDVRGINADDLEAWLEKCPAVHRWFARLIGKLPGAGTWDLEKAWNLWRNRTGRPLTEEIVLCGRSDQSQSLCNHLDQSPVILSIKAPSEEEAYAFVLATLTGQEKYSSRVLIVQNQEHWDYLRDSQNALILIPRNFVPEGIGYAKQRGHHIIIPTDLTLSPPIISENMEEVSLGQMNRENRIQALQSMGFSEGEASQIYSDTKGHLGPISRHKLLAPQDRQTPDWVGGDKKTVLIYSLLATEWNCGSTADQVSLSKLSDMPYEKFEEQLFDLTHHKDPPVRQVGNIWQVVAKLDLWSLMAHKINQKDLERFGALILGVLGENDPAYDLPPKDRWMAALKNATTQYSEKLKTGLADSITLLSAHGESFCPLLKNLDIKGWSDHWVEKLLTKDLTARGWYSLRKNLIPLAEASPESFLFALEKSMAGNVPPIADLFIEEGTMGGCPHASLLWAIETISWKLDYLSSAISALARLSEIDLGGRFQNRPFNSLKEIFLGWRNNTTASHQELLEIMDSCLIKRFPKVAWRLFLTIFEESIRGTFPSSLHQPKYQSWSKGIKRITQKECENYLLEIEDRLLNLVEEDPQARWPKLVKRLPALSKKNFDQCLQKLNALNINDLRIETRLSLTNTLRETISLHKKCQGEKWVLPKKEIAQLEKLHKIIEIDDLVLKNKYLFDTYLPTLISPIPKEMRYREGHEGIILRHRIKAVKEIYKEEGIQGIQRLVEISEHPGFLGEALTKVKFLKSIEEDILSWLESGNDRLQWAAHAFVSIYSQKNKKWIPKILRTTSAWSENKLTQFFLALPFGAATFQILKEQKREVYQKYWQQQNRCFLEKEDLKEINWVMKQLLDNGRPVAAIDVAGHILHTPPGKETTLLDGNLILKILFEIAYNPGNYQGVSMHHIKHDLLGALHFIQNHDGIKREELVNIEWLYLRVLRFDSFHPKYLEEEVLSNPQFFAELISWMHKPRGERMEIQEEDLDEDSVMIRAKNAADLFESLSKIPGQKQDNSVALEELKAWILEARKQLKKLYRSESGDYRIGRLLAKSPFGSDGIWPHEAVREILEELASAEIEQVIETEKRNLRGMTCRNPYDGGKQERELVKEYYKQADKIRLKWPRTASLLRNLAKSYKREASRHDQDVELWE